MTARFRRVVVFVGTATLAAGAGVGAAAQGDSTDRSPAPSITQPQGPGGGGGARGGVDVGALADSLGVSETELQQGAPPSGQATPSGGTIRQS